MKLLIKLVALWGVADSIWLATKSDKWSNFWGKAVGTISGGKTTARSVAALQFVLCLWMLNNIKD